jgi:hypothetical protein
MGNSHTILHFINLLYKDDVKVLQEMVCFDTFSSEMIQMTRFLTRSILATF